MPADQIELKFTSTLTSAFHALKCATRHSPLVLLCHSKEFLDELYLTLQTLIQASDAASSNHLGQKISLYHWQSWEHAPFSPVTSSITQKIERLKTLEALNLNADPMVILASVDSWIQPTLPKSVYDKLHTTLSLNSDIGSRESLRDQLRALGYAQAETVEEPGQYAIRGEILDLYIPTQTTPYRIEFFDTMIETIRPFHPETQRTLKNSQPVTSLSITSAEEVIFPWGYPSQALEVIKEYCDQNQISRKIRDPIFENIRNGFLPDNYRVWIPFIYGGTGALADYLPSETRIMVLEPEQVKIELKQNLETLKKEEQRYELPHWISPSFELLYSRAEGLLQAGLKSAHWLVRSAPLSDHTQPAIPTETISFERLTEKDVFEWLDDGFFVWVGSRGLTHQERLKFLLKKVQSNPFFKILDRDNGESLQFLTEKTIIVSESLFFGKSNLPPKKSTRGPTEAAFKQGETEVFSQPSDLNVGDFVVHSLHGVGKYLGLQELSAKGATLGEYLLIEYSGGDKLWLPVYRLNTIQKYIGAGGNPSIDKLGTQQFEKAKQKARDSAKKLAINLVEIYAKRATLRGAPFVEQNQDYLDFADEFEFTETEGQINAIQATLADVESGRLLDRLVCGDVGFGKTEVAMRVAFQAVQSGFQVALLVPTTLLAFQHEQSFKRRMNNFPIRVESISRFKTKKQQTALLKELAEGQIDIMIGTHRLLSKDVHWNRLGILIVDEEHRFGVEHKEKMKAIQADTHSLTLTATPIPRTLNMALSGLKEISLIKTPPTNRQPIKTYVSQNSDELIKSAIENELARGGQVFYLYNRVQTIENRAKELRELMPQARIIVAHGQMGEGEIESKMIEFYQGHAQILLCTTIIESGIDVPNAGTIIIHRADQLGLAQLYQIRGRVGRSHRKAFAYLLVDEDRTLTQEAKMRLDVLQRFVELGAGFQIASHDLEIRGGGNFLGAEQSGHIASVGMDLFTELLEEAIQELRGKKIDVDERHYEPEIQVPVVCEIDVALVSDAKIRLSLYRKLSNARSNAQVDLLYDELKDRFGKISQKTENLFWLIRIKNLLKQVGIEQLSVSVQRVSMTVRKTTLIEVDEVMKLYTGPKTMRDPRVSITPDSKIVFQLPFESLQSHLFELENLFKKIAPKAFENQKMLIN
jgi:transcription-repair coupling factor (superfamily II helicase)